MAPATAALVPVQQRVITWDDNGQPVLSAEPVLTRNHLQSLYFVVAAQPYEITDPLDPDFGLYDGMTVAEVLVRKQLLNAARTGNQDEIEKVMDRLIGKAMARSENLNLSASYEEYLKRLAAKTQGAQGAKDERVVETTAGNDENVFGDLA